MAINEWWFVPETISDTLTDLIHSPTHIIEGSKPIKKADQLSVYLNGVFIDKSYNKSNFLYKKPNTNNLMIASSFQSGSSPTVQRIHFYKENEESGIWIGELFKSLVCSFEDFTDEHLTLKCQVYDIKDLDKYRNALDAISNMTDSISVAFPIISTVSLAFPIAKDIINLIDNFEEHIKIVDENIRLEIAPDNRGAHILQTGHWIFFNEPQEEGLKVNAELRVIDKDGKTDFTGCSYAIYSIRNIKDEEPNWEIDQKSAKLLSQLNGKGSPDKASIDFVRDTIDAYTKFKKLQRLQELQSKKDLTDSEKALLERLKSDKDIQPFLPKQS